MKSLDWHINALGLSNNVLDEILTIAGISDQYLGTFPVSELNNIPPFTLERLYITLIYIDSFGHPVKDSRVKQFIKARAPNLPLYYSSTQIQSKSSTYCGLYAVLYTLYFDRCNNFKGKRKSTSNVIGRQQYVWKPIAISALPTKSHLNHHHPPMTLFFYKNNPTLIIGNDALCISYIKRLANMFININMRRNK